MNMKRKSFLIIVILTLCFIAVSCNKQKEVPMTINRSLWDNPVDSVVIHYIDYNYLSIINLSYKAFLSDKSDVNTQILRNCAKDSLLKHLRTCNIPTGSDYVNARAAIFVHYENNVDIYSMDRSNILKEGDKEAYIISDDFFHYLKNIGVIGSDIKRDYSVDPLAEEPR